MENGKLKDFILFYDTEYSHVLCQRALFTRNADCKASGWEKTVESEVETVRSKGQILSWVENILQGESLGRYLLLV